MEIQTAGNISMRLLIIFLWVQLLTELFFVFMEACHQIYQLSIKWDWLIENNKFLMKVRWLT